MRIKRSVISRKLKAAGIALAFGLLAKAGITADQVPAQAETFIVWAATVGAAYLVRESEAFIEERTGRDVITD